MSVLVTGGAGYIGAHVVRLLREKNEDVVVVDDLSTGDAVRVSGAPILQLDITAPASIDAMAAQMSRSDVSSVIHFAARKRVGESVNRPAWYYQQNLTGLANVITAMEVASVQKLVFSSSAAVYGTPDLEIVPETAATTPVNPYGETKLAGEWLVRAAGRAWGLRGVSLRYFNVAGAGWPDLGDPVVMNLVTMVLDRLSRGERPLVFGADYATPDGSGVRDFVHVLDLAEAHLASLVYLDRPERAWDVFNVGTGAGSSVFEVIREIGRTTGLDTTPEVIARRPGDPARVVARVDRVAEELGWHARAGLPEILASAWAAWQVGERAFPHR